MKYNNFDQLKKVLLSGEPVIEYSEWRVDVFYKKGDKVFTYPNGYEDDIWENEDEGNLKFTTKEMLQYSYEFTDFENWWNEIIEQENYFEKCSVYDLRDVCKNSIE